ncbi:hypothetical protein IV203_021504 [Nitzschia inconspicua]|uniref:Uncharacterized protein n=1 Tax=Nitzschia inconspicua TaxID=303405 RepID=A0A9K3K947_9STRA|nr:hypothetical protein IV203_022702 [Nitzschia inconspicua]KAG7343559.1 hypothetical protein IV203_021504 [Nitzschia inconspicua]
MFHFNSNDNIPAAFAATTSAVVVDAVSSADPPLVDAVAVTSADPPLAVDIEYEAIPKLLFVDMQQEDEEKVAAAVSSFADNFAASNANTQVNKDQATSLGAIAIILLLMRKWHYNRSIQCHGCSVLGRLIVSNGRLPCVYCSNPTPAVSIIKSGGIETITAAMKSFPDHDKIQSYGCTAIGNAFYYTNPTIDKAMACFVHKLDGIELVVLTMKKFPMNVSVQYCCCYVLNQLSKKQVLRDALMRGSALSAVGEATEKHATDKDLGNKLHSMAAVFFENMFQNKKRKC